MPISNHLHLPDHHHPNHHEQNQEEDLLNWDDLQLTDIIEGFDFDVPEDFLFPEETVPPPVEVVQQQPQQPALSVMEKNSLLGDELLVLSEQASISRPVAKAAVNFGVSSEPATRPPVVPNRRSCIRGVPWTESEHRLFLMGMQTHGRGEWSKIARDFVKTKTATQVASHAQKFFRRMESKRRRNRPSINDITIANGPSPFGRHFKSIHELLALKGNLMASASSSNIAPVNVPMGAQMATQHSQRPVMRGNSTARAMNERVQRMDKGFEPMYIGRAQQMVIGGPQRMTGSISAITNEKKYHNVNEGRVLNMNNGRFPMINGSMVHFINERGEVKSINVRSWPMFIGVLQAMGRGGGQRVQAMRGGGGGGIQTMGEEVRGIQAMGGRGVKQGVQAVEGETRGEGGPRMGGRGGGCTLRMSGGGGGGRGLKMSGFGEVIEEYEVNHY